MVVLLERGIAISWRCYEGVEFYAEEKSQRFFVFDACCRETKSTRPDFVEVYMK